MCGRFTLEKSIGSLGSLFGVAVGGELSSRYNIAPTQPITAIRQTPHGEERELVVLRWGLVPAWSKEPGEVPLLINARAESAAEKPAFRVALRRRRCSVPADGFYEWQQTPPKQAYQMRRRDGQPFALAALWERWEGPAGEIESCALLTTEANEPMAPFHHRMPVILDPPQFDLWLDPEVLDLGLVQSLLCAYPAEAMVAHPVGSHVNRARNDDPRCVLPLD